MHGTFAFPVFISPIVWNMCENLPYESVYFKEVHNEHLNMWARSHEKLCLSVHTKHAHFMDSID